MLTAGKTLGPYKILAPLGAGLDFIRPGRPVQNAFGESFNGKMRDRWLSAHWWRTIAEARAGNEEFRWIHNTIRPHRSLGGRMPEEFVAAEGEPSVAVCEPLRRGPVGRCRASWHSVPHLRWSCPKSRATSRNPGLPLVDGRCTLQEGVTAPVQGAELEHTPRRRKKQVL